MRGTPNGAFTLMNSGSCGDFSLSRDTPSREVEKISDRFWVKKSDREQDEVIFDVVSVSWGIKASGYLVVASRLNLL